MGLAQGTSSVVLVEVDYGKEGSQGRLWGEEGSGGGCGRVRAVSGEDEEEREGPSRVEWPGVVAYGAF